jgi:hypothetical protein
MEDPIERVRRTQKKRALDEWEIVQDQRDKETQPKKQKLPESQLRINQVALQAIRNPKSSQI